MSYHTDGTGWISIHPPVPVSTLDGIYLGPLAGHIITETEPADAGWARQRAVVDRIQPSHEDEWRADVSAVASAAARVAAAIPAGHVLRGHIYGEGEEPGDVWRVQVAENGTSITVQRAEMRWPDGTRVDRETEWTDSRSPWRLSP